MAKNNAFYFSHDMNARTDPKMLKVIMRLGLEGIGLYWCLIELLHEQEGYILMSECESIAFNFHIKKEVVLSLISDFDLFKNDENKFWSERVLRNFTDRLLLSESARERANKRWKKPKNNAIASQNDAIAYENNAIASNLDTSAMQEKCKGNAIKERKGKEIKEKEDNNNSNELSLSKKSEISEFENHKPAFEKFEKWILENTPFVAKMKNPFTFDQFLKIRGIVPIGANKIEIHAEEIKTYLMQLENNKDYQKKYLSPYLCCLQWHKNSKNKK